MATEWITENSCNAGATGSGVGLVPSLPHCCCILRSILFLYGPQETGIRQVEELTFPEITARCSNGAQSKCIDWLQVSARDDVRQGL
jgi:hypothetical protein